MRGEKRGPGLTLAPCSVIHEMDERKVNCHGSQKEMAVRHYNVLKEKGVRCSIIPAGKYTRDKTQFVADTIRAQDYKEISSMDWCSTHNLFSEMT